MRLARAYIVYYLGAEVGLIKARSLQDAEDKASAYFNTRAFNLHIQPTEVDADKEEFGWYKTQRPI